MPRLSPCFRRSARTDGASADSRRQEKQIQIYQIRKYAKVAVGGKLVETTPGLAAEVFDVLGQANIHFYQITTSKRTISLVIDKENLDQAIQLLKERFHIEEDK